MFLGYFRTSKRSSKQAWQNSQLSELFLRLHSAMFTYNMVSQRNKLSNDVIVTLSIKHYFHQNATGGWMAVLGRGSYLERLVGHAVSVVSTNTMFVAVVNHQHQQSRQCSCCSRRQPRDDDAQAGATVRDACLCEQWVADGQVLVGGE